MLATYSFAKKGFLAGTIIATLFALFPVSTDALTFSESELQAQIATLTAQLQALLLQRQIIASQQTPSGSICPDITHTLYLGRTDTNTAGDVSALQRLIAHSTGDTSFITGYFGKRTQAAVRNLQSNLELEADGVVGKLTATAIRRECSAQSADLKTFTDPTIGFSFQYPADEKVENLKTFTYKGGFSVLEARTLPMATEMLGIADVIGYRIGTPEDLGVTAEHPFLSFTSCCSGTYHWLDQSKPAWRAETFSSGETTQDSNGNLISLPQKREKLGLIKNGACAIQHRLGDTTYTELESWDEGAERFYFYFVPLSDGRLLMFSAALYSPFTDYSTYGPGTRPPQRTLNTIKTILSTLSFRSGHPTAGPIFIPCE